MAKRLTDKTVAHPVFSVETERPSPTKGQGAFSTAALADSFNSNKAASGLA